MFPCHKITIFAIQFSVAHLSCLTREGHSTHMPLPAGGGISNEHRRKMRNFTDPHSSRDPVRRSKRGNRGRPQLARLPGRLGASLEHQSQWPCRLPEQGISYTGHTDNDVESEPQHPNSGAVTRPSRKGRADLLSIQEGKTNRSW